MYIYIHTHNICIYKGFSALFSRSVISLRVREWPRRNSLYITNVRDRKRNIPPSPVPPVSFILVYFFIIYLFYYYFLYDPPPSDIPEAGTFDESTRRVIIIVNIIRAAQCENPRFYIDFPRRCCA